MTAPRPMPQVRALIRSLRPHQWVKNLFVLAPLVFAKRLITSGGDLNWHMLALAAAAFLVFCLTSGAVYLLNDLVDRDKDRLHPVKRNRPIASGALPINTARVALVAVLVGAVGASAAVRLPFAATVLAYFALNVAYSLRLKHIPFLDVFSISLGFLLRVAGGALAIGVPVTVWLYVTTFSLASFLALGKRSHELRVAGALASQTRRVLERYRAPIVHRALLFFGVVTAICYVAYTLSEHAYRQFGSRHLVWTIPFIVFGLGRFTWLVRRTDTPESPTELMVRDVPFLANLGLWAACVAWVIYAL